MELMATAGFLVDVGRSLREALFMFWETLWALVLGFTLSGIVQAFVRRERLESVLGRRSPRAVTTATGLGMVSSSCSYAASAMAKSLFAKGADFITAMVFMVASTNLVIELGLVLLVLMGWQFMAAEFVGGPIMIVLFASVGGLVLTAPLIARARARVEEASSAARTHASAERQRELEAERWSTKLRSPAAWADASNFAVADVTMLRTEMVVGYLVAGFLAVLVPTSWWNALFVQGNGIWTALENALVGPIIAVVAWVCSVGNVPLAAALWSGGISFGGVVAFVFADLIAMPLILIYAKFYGWRLTMRLVATFYVVMVVAGLLTQLIFGGLGIVPTHRALATMHPAFRWNYTTFLNLAFLVVAAGVWWQARNRRRFGGGLDYAVDPVCGMQVRIADAPATASHEGRSFSFCSDRCKERFEQDLGRFADHQAIEGMEAPSVALALGATPMRRAHHVDPMCQMEVDPATAAAHRRFEADDYYFCSPGCAARFDEDPAGALSASASHQTPR
jgi:uncharacterized protein